ncbi:AAEL017193-PA [Aedes aegypti]|uniref:AAEL017193-PA n=1 Tax=Aedes aegypti TaxID=7159 RepID=J9HEX5_AEDAE|nr:AAEL017193-PA [Aedes aegypti]
MGQLVFIFVRVKEYRLLVRSKGSSRKPKVC